MTEDIKDKLNISTPTGAKFLDVKKAFDKVWHHGLIYKLKREQFPRKLVNIIQIYLHGRTFRVRIGDKLSKGKEVNAGVPQGSVVGPLLYNIYTADIPTPDKCKLAQFADNTELYISRRMKSAVQKGLQEDLQRIRKYFETWKIKVNPNNTVGVYFDHRNRERKPPEVIYNGHPIAWEKKTKYLGVIMDGNLKFRTQILENIKKARQMQAYLNPLLNEESRMSIENKMKIIKTIIIPGLTYGGEI
ncbi:hypothetical protein WA026_006301 [Henosepilachna vigintioctopunctata]|uniref:Reverse transcriptase domain-containing protein n=1 Tax=Henosepilachna vigintioctopunctata TaxID=420089 RepID=A0AAW1TPV7_9CUCU